MSRRKWLALTLGATAAFGGRTEGSEKFFETEEAGVNPERGFYVQMAAAGKADFGSIRKGGSSLVLLTLDLREHRAGALTDSTLEKLELSLIEIRKAGLKAVFRAAYGFTDDDYRVDPMDLNLIRSHIRQMARLLSRHAPVVWAVQAGMLGPWGEWHGSSHGDVPSLEARRCVVDAWLEGLPATTFLQVRRPRFIREMFPSEKQAGFSRVGWHNDAMLALPDDMGTYDEPGWSRERELEWCHARAAGAPFGGETVPASEATDAPQVMRELGLLGITYLNKGYHKGTLDGWRGMDFEGRTLFDQVNRKLGYRWVVRRCQPMMENGMTALEFENVGFAPVYSDRNLEAAWLDPISHEPTHEMVNCGVDLRGHGPEAGLLKVEFKMPAPIDGAVLGLRLPDPVKALRGDGRYALRLMNKGVGFDESSGWNVIG